MPYASEVLKNPALVEIILASADVFPPVPEQPERILRCFSENVDRAIARAFARATVRGELWRIQLVDRK